MKREELEHLIRAASVITDDDGIVVIGSQSILGRFPDAPPELLVSVEADLFPLHRPERWDLIDGTIGEGSPFHGTFGYYAQGVGPETAVLPAGWRERLVPIRQAGTTATGWALEPHDLMLAKLVAGREKDIEFVGEGARHGLVRKEVLLERLHTMPVAPEMKTAVEIRIRRAFAYRKSDSGV